MLERGGVRVDWDRMFQGHDYWLGRSVFFILLRQLSLFRTKGM